MQFEITFFIVSTSDGLNVTLGVLTVLVSYDNFFLNTFANSYIAVFLS